MVDSLDPEVETNLIAEKEMIDNIRDHNGVSFASKIECLEEGVA